MGDLEEIIGFFSVLAAKSATFYPQVINFYPQVIKEKGYFGGIKSTIFDRISSNSSTPLRFAYSLQRNSHK